MTTTLNQLALGNSARVADVQGEDSISVRMMEMGLLEGVTIKAIGAAPFGGPREYMIRGFRLSLRDTEACRVVIAPL